MNTNTFELTERQLNALIGTLSTRGKTKGRRKASAPSPFGSDAYIAYQAYTLVFNPYRMPSEFILLFNGAQHDFMNEMEQVYQRMGKEPAARAAVTKQIKQKMRW